MENKDMPRETVVLPRGLMDLIVAYIGSRPIADRHAYQIAGGLALMQQWAAEASTDTDTPE